MAFQVYVGSVAFNTTTGSQTVSPSGLGFTPVGGIFMGASRTTDSQGAPADWWMGTTQDATHERYAAFESESASANADVGAIMGDTASMGGLTTNNAADFLADFTSWNSSPAGFTFNISNAPAAAYALNYILLGGDVTGIEPFVLNVGTTTPLSFSSLSGRPSCVIFYTSARQTAADTLVASSVDAYSMAGWMCADGTQGVAGSYHQDGAGTMVTKKWQRTDGCIDLRSNSTSQLNLAFSSMDANGFTLSGTISTSSIRIYGVAIYGGTWKAGAFTSRTSSGSASVTTTGVNPKLVMLQTFDVAANTATQGNGDRGIGAGDGTRRFTLMYFDNDTAGSSLTQSAHLSTKVLISPRNAYQYALDSLDTEGFTYSTTSTPTGIEILYLVGGDAAAASASITPPVGAVTASGVAPGRVEARFITPAVGTLTTTGVAASVSSGILIQPATGTLAVSGAASSILRATLIAAPVGALTLTGAAPTVNAAVSATPAVGTITLTGLAPAAVQGRLITPTVGAVTATGVAPAAVQSQLITPTVGAVAISGVAPTILQSRLITPTVGTLTVAGVGPVPVQNRLITPSVGTVTATGVTPLRDVGLVPSVGALTLTGQAPGIGGQTALTPTVGSLTLAGAAPNIVTPVNVTPSAGAMTLAGVAPGRLTDTRITPATGSLTGAGIAPSAVSGTLRTPTLGAVTLAGAAPRLDLGLSPPAGSLTLQGQAPALRTPITLTPAAGALSLTGTAPVTRLAVSLTPAAGALVVTGLAPIAALGVARTPQVGTLLAAGATPTILAGRVLVPDAGGLVVLGLVPSSDQGILAAAGALVLAGAAPEVVDSGAAPQPILILFTGEAFAIPTYLAENFAIAEHVDEAFAVGVAQDETFETGGGP
jgi:hypothetical protein